MMFRLALAAAFLTLASAASAQTYQGNASGTDTTSTTMKELLAQGYEIKTAVPNGSKFVVFMQKDQSAYACEFVSLTDTKCGAIN
jgi:hypothetical protein